MRKLNTETDTEIKTSSYPENNATCFFVLVEI